MNKRANHMHARITNLAGFSILEVMIGVFIFAVGLLALSSMQGALTRSMADSKVRTTAVNIAERTIEGHRGFSQIISDTAVPPTFIAYNDIVDSTETETVNGITYTVTTDVTDHYYSVSTDGFTTTAPAGALNSTYKQIEVTVSWNAAQNLRGNEGEEISIAELGGGDIVVTASIPALVTSASAMVSQQTDTGGTAAPDIAYTPGANPDIVSLSLGDNKFKESLLPQPDVTRVDELVETKFDVITYSQSGSGATFLRREEFATVSCECTLKAPSEDNPGHRPVVWGGDEYVRGQHAVKAYGVSANNQQSYLCDSCCNDHHDGGTSVGLADHSDTAVNTYVPFKASTERITSGTFLGDHKHYARSRKGAVTEVTSAGSVYVEACRLVRVDGFFRVMQDFRREDMHVFPADFLDDTNEIDFYSGFVTDAAAAYAKKATGDYETNPPCIGDSPCTIAGAPKQGAYDAEIAVDGDDNPTELPSWTTLPYMTATGVTADTQQLRSRGVYIDYLSSDLRQVLASCVDGAKADDDACKYGDVVLDRTGSVNALELIPFFDVQLTKLTRWNEAPDNLYIDTTNQPLATLNAHSRGVISKLKNGGPTVVTATGSRGNLNFTDTLPIDPTYMPQNATISVQAGVATAPPPPGKRIAGHLSETVPGDPIIVITGQNGARCGQTSEAYWCIVPDDAVNPRIEISGYGKKLTDRWACSVGSALSVDTDVSMVTNGVNAKATYNISDATTGENYDFVIQGVVCPPPPPPVPPALPAA